MNEFTSNLLTTLKDDYTHINSVIVSKNQERVFEEYFNNADKDTLFNTACIFKSFLSTLIGICIDKGYIESLNTKLGDVFTNEFSNLDSNLTDVTIKHLLTKTSGIKWPPPFYQFQETDNIDEIDFFLDQSLEDAPGTEFKYKPDPYFIPFIIERVSRQKFNAFLYKYLFKPLNIDTYKWNTHFTAREILQLTTRDIAKLGDLYLNSGVYNGSRIISESYIKEATSSKVTGGPPEFEDYGFLWWITDISNLNAFYASGFGGQYLYIVPELDLHITITSRLNKPHPENKVLIKQIVESIDLL